MSCLWEYTRFPLVCGVLDRIFHISNGPLFMCGSQSSVCVWPCLWSVGSCMTQACSLFLWVRFGSVSLCSPGPHSVGQAGLQFRKTNRLCLSSTGNKGLGTSGPLFLFKCSDPMFLLRRLCIQNPLVLRLHMESYFVAVSSRQL